MAAGLHCQYDNISGYKLKNYNAIRNIFVTIENLLAVSICFVGFGIQGGTVKFMVFAPPLNLTHLTHLLDTEGARFKLTRLNSNQRSDDDQRGSPFSCLNKYYYFLFGGIKRVCESFHFQQ